MFRRKAATCFAALALLAVGCGSGTDAATTVAPGTSSAATSSAPATTANPPTTSAAPATVDPAAFPTTIAAANGDIEIAAAPTRVISLSATHTEMLFALGAGDQVIAADSFSNYPAAAPTTDLSAFSPNVEAIVELDADLVVIDGDWDGAAVGALTDLGVPVLVLPAATDLEDVYTQITLLGQATDNVDEAAQLVEQMRTDVTSILSSLPSGDGPLTFYHELDNTYYSVTSETFIGQVYSSMGLVNIADAVGDGSFGFPQLSEEYILEQDPNLIFLADTVCCGVDGESLKERPGWNTLTAVANGSVVELSDDVASRWGPRIVDYMRAVADAIVAFSASG